MLFNYSKDNHEQNILLLEQYQKATNNSVIVSKTDNEGVIIYANDEFCKISGYSADELIGKNHNIIRHPNNPKSIYKKIWNTIKNEKKTWKGMIRNKTKDNISYYVKTTITPILDKNNNILEYIALRDDITDVMNPKRQLNDFINSTDNTIIALLKIEGFDDIENFYGQNLTHQIEDTFANDILNYSPIDEMFKKVYILGNGEYAFAKDLRDCTDKIEISIDKLKEFQENIDAAHINIGTLSYDVSVMMSVSYGKNSLENARYGMKNLIKTNHNFIISNDLAKQEHKKAKKNIKTIRMIQKAVDDFKIISYFQPIINNATNTIEKYESLVRLVDKDENIVSPYEFINVSKKGRYYARITSVVLENSFDALLHTDMDITINISVLDIEKESTREKLFELLDKHKKDATRIVFELLEDEEVKDFNIIKDFISHVKNIGVKIAIDDFGAGYSNFIRLLEYQPDIIKIDGSLIKNIETNKLSLSVVKTIVAFAKDQNIKTVAEYVANKNIFNILKDLGVDYSQGFYFAQPDSLIIKKELSKKTISLVKSTAQLITENQYDIADKMYELLFEKYPQFKKLFTNNTKLNRSRIADAISAYAVNIDKINILTPALKEIAKVHVNAGIAPEYYVMLGACLIDAMQEVLDTSATDEFIYAWREAYRYLSAILIENEAELKKEL